MESLIQQRTIIDHNKLRITLAMFPAVGPMNNAMLEIIRPLLKEYRELIKGQTYRIKLKKNIPVEIEADVIFNWVGDMKSPAKLKSTKITGLNKLTSEQSILSAVMDGRQSELACLDIVEKANKEQDIVVNTFLAKVTKTECNHHYPINFLYRILVDQVNR